MVGGGHFPVCFCCEIRRPEKREGADSKFAPLLKGYDTPCKKYNQEERALMGAFPVACFLHLKSRSFQ